MTEQQGMHPRDVHARMHRGNRFEHLREELRRSVRWLGVLAAFVVGTGAIYVYFVGHTDPTIFGGTRTVEFAVQNVKGIAPGQDQVEFKGVPAGTISAVRMQGTTPVITAQIETKYGPIYRDAQAEFRPTTALNDMYLDIVSRGTPAAGLASPSAPLAASQTQTTVNVVNVLDMFHANVRSRLAAILDNLGNGLKDHGAALRAAFVQIAPFLRIAQQISADLAERPLLTQELIHNTDRITTELAWRQQTLRELVASGSRTFAALQLSSRDLGSTLHELPPTLSGITTAFAAVRTIVPALDSAVVHLYPVADRVPSALTDLTQLSNEAQPAIAALQTPVQRLVPFAQTLVPLSQYLKSSSSTLMPQLPTINHAVADLAGCKIGVQGFFQWDESLLKFGDYRGDSPRGNAAEGAGAVGLPSPSEFFPKACTPGPVLGSGLPTAADEH
jgi:ABC-type transporter Mla subunit MlaD